MVVSEVYSYSQQSGILKNLFSKNENYYNDDISIFVSGEDQNAKKEYAFNFDSSNYWVNNEIGFCFKKGRALITKYEIQTSSGLRRPSIWSFAGSNDRVHWKHVEKQNHQMSAEEIYPVDWNHGIYRCYQIVGINNIYEAAQRIDIRQIEIFGTYFPNGISMLQCSNRFKRCSELNPFFIMMLLFTT